MTHFAFTALAKSRGPIQYIRSLLIVQYAALSLRLKQQVSGTQYTIYFSANIKFVWRDSSTNATPSCVVVIKHRDKLTSIYLRYT